MKDELEYYKQRARILGDELMRIVEGKKQMLLDEKRIFLCGFYSGRKTKFNESKAWQKFKGYIEDGDD